MSIMHCVENARHRLLSDAAHRLAIGQFSSAREALRAASAAMGLADSREWPDEREVEAVASSLALNSTDLVARRQSWARDALDAMAFLQPHRCRVEEMPLYSPFGEQPDLVLWLFEDSAESVLLELEERRVPARLVRRRLYQIGKPTQAAISTDCVSFVAGHRQVTLVVLPESMRSHRFGWEPNATAVELLSESGLRSIAQTAGPDLDQPS